MKVSLIALLFTCVVAFASATVYFQEEFNDGWENRWVRSTVDDAQGTAGKFHTAVGDVYNNPEQDQGLKTGEDARFYKLSAAFPEFSNKGKDLVIQYSVKDEQRIDCGGAYVKLFPSGLDQTTMTGESTYNIMFGPDICGVSNKKIHFILNYKGENHLIKKNVKPVDDALTHLYTAIIHPDQTYEIRVDNEVKQSGSLLEDWDFLPPKEIPDPEAHKPEDWVDEAEIADPEATKPEGWDDIPKEITDPEATKPEDWDDELDGEWEAPLIPNPEYKGEWEPPMIPNPEYKGAWVHPKIPNPEYFTDDEIYAFDSHAFIGFEVWQVKSGTIFDHILVTDSVEEAEAFATGYFAEQQKGEKAAAKAKEEEKAREEEAKRKLEEAEATKNGDNNNNNNDDDDDDDDDDNTEAHDEL